MATEGRKLIARKKAKVINDWGLHARPSANIASVARTFKSEITISYQGKQAPALSVASLLMLEAPNGAELLIEATGVDARPAALAIVAAFEHAFGEDHVVLKGQGTHCGTVVGAAHVSLDKPVDIPRYSILKSAVAAEKQRLKQAVAEVRKEFKSLVKTSDDAQVRDFQKLLLAILHEDHISVKPLAYIQKHLVNAEWALKVNVMEIIDQFNARDHPVWTSRANEYFQIMLRLISQLQSGVVKQRRRRKPGAGKIIIANDMGPAEVLEYHKAGYIGFATAVGSLNSHMAILARGLGIAAIVGLERNALLEITEDAILAIDSNASELHVKPGKAPLQQLRKQAAENSKQIKALATMRRTSGRPRTVTKDGVRIQLMANVGFLEEIDTALENGAEGIGLFRTEFLFMGSNGPLSEVEQYTTYRNVIERLEGRPVTFRTLDIGHDKLLQNGESTAGTTALGVRAIRYSLREPALFKEQLRALLRAAQHGPMKIMLPLISNESELTSALQLVKDSVIELELTKRQLPEIGIMIEIPGTVFILEQLAQSSDFFSIGSNDLIQYTLAVDRNEATLAGLADPFHPGVINLLGMIIHKSNVLAKPLTMCGELAADLGMLRFCCTLGLRTLSMNPAKLVEVHEALTNFNITKNVLVAGRIAKCSSTSKIKELLPNLTD